MKVDIPLLIIALLAVVSRGAPFEPAEDLRRILQTHITDLEYQTGLEKDATSMAATSRKTQHKDAPMFVPPAVTVYGLANLIIMASPPVSDVLLWTSSVSDFSRSEVFRLMKLQSHQRILDSLTYLRERVVFELECIKAYATRRYVRKYHVLNRRLQPLLNHFTAIRRCIGCLEIPLLDEHAFAALIHQFVQITLPLVQQVEMPETDIAAVEAALQQHIFVALQTTGGNYRSVLGALMQTRMELKRIWNMLDNPSREVVEKLEESKTEIEQHMANINVGLGLDTWPADSPLLWLIA